MVSRISNTGAGRQAGEQTPPARDSNAIAAVTLAALASKARQGFAAHGPGILFAEMRPGTNPVHLSAYLTEKTLTSEGYHPRWRMALAEYDPDREVLICMYSTTKTRLHRVGIAGAGGGMAALN